MCAHVHVYVRLCTYAWVSVSVALGRPITWKDRAGKSQSVEGFRVVGGACRWGGEACATVCVCVCGGGGWRFVSVTYNIRPPNEWPSLHTPPHTNTHPRVSIRAPPKPAKCFPVSLSEEERKSPSRAEPRHS